MPIAQPGLVELQRLCDESSAAPLLLLLTCSAHPRCNEAARVQALYSLETAALNYSSGSLRFARSDGAAFPLSALNLRGNDLPAIVLFNAPATHVFSQAAVAAVGGWKPEAVPYLVDAARRGAAPPFIRSEHAPPISLSERTLQTASAASLAEARTSMRQIVLLLHPGAHEPRGRPHGAAPAPYTAPPCAAWPSHAPPWRWLAGALPTHSEGGEADAQPWCHHRVPPGRRGGTNSVPPRQPDTTPLRLVYLVIVTASGTKTIKSSVHTCSLCGPA